MNDDEDERDTWLLSQLLAVKRCLEAAKRKEHQHAASELKSTVDRTHGIQPARMY